MTTPIQNECDFDQHLRSFLDRELPRQMAADVKAHVATCADCRQAIALMTAVDGELAAWRGATTPSAGLRERIADAMDGEARPVAIIKVRSYRIPFAIAACAVVIFAAINFPQPQTSFAPARSLGPSSDTGAVNLRQEIPASAQAPMPASKAFTVPETRSDDRADAPIGKAEQLTSSSATSPASANDTVSPPEPGNAYTAIPRQLIYTAEVDITVPKLADGEQSLSRLVSIHRGYIATSNVNGATGDLPGGSWTVRVPVSQFEGFMGDIARLGKVNSVHRDSQDVTDEYYDLQAHIANKQIEEARLKEYMQAKSQKLADILTLEQELSRVRGEIEEMQGRLRLMSHQADMSTVTITLSEARKPAPKPVKASFGSLLGQSFLRSVGGMVDTVKEFAVWFAGTVPTLLLVLAALLLARWQWRRSMDKPVV